MEHKCYLVGLFIASLSCWTKFCDSENDWCVQECNSNEACFASFISVYHNSTTPIIAGQEYSCLTAGPDDCLNNRCELSSSPSTVHRCCCRKDLCNAVDSVVPGVTAPTQGPLLTPSGTLPMQMGDYVVCESFQPQEHIYKQCEICTATYVLTDGEYVLETKGCLNSTLSPSTSCDNRTCVLDTAGTSDPVTCCCTDYLCNSQLMLSFTDVTRVSDYVHTSVCDGANCSHSCVVINELPHCICDNGFAMHMNGVDCIDINECLMTPSPCDQVCENAPGSYVCECVEGYRRLDNGSCADAGLACGRKLSTTALTGITYCDDVLEGIAPADRQSCQAIYTNHGGLLVPALLNCITNQEPSGEECLQSECSLNFRPNNGFYRCCCNVSFCNLKVVHPPNETPITTPAATDEAQSTDPGTVSSDREIAIGVSSGSAIAIGVTVAIVVMVAGAVLILIVVIVVIILCRWSRCCHHSSSLPVEGAVVYNRPNPSYNVSEDVSLLDEIGRGRYSRVHLGQRNGSSVAVKCFEDKESFTKEVSIYCTEGLQHENVLKYLDSIQREKISRYWIIFEYHSRGSLYAMLSETTVTHKEFVILAESAASGLAFLHFEKKVRDKTIKPCIVHRDLKSKNILIKSNGQCVISDFGLSIKFPLVDEQEGRRQVGTFCYMAPEVLEGSIYFDCDSYKQIDCYALGVIFYEILTRTEASGEPVPPYSPPFSERVPQQSVQDMKEAVVKCRYRPAIPDRFIKNKPFDRITVTIVELWDSVPGARLTAEATSERMKLYMLETFDEKTTDSSLDIEDFSYSTRSYTAETTV